MKRFLFGQLIVLMLLSSLLYAQTDYVSLLVSAYGSLPAGDFAKKVGENPILTRRSGFDIGEYVGLAKAGYGLGIELNTPVLVSGLGWVISLRLLANSTDPTTAEAAFEHFMGDSVDIIYETGTWINFPVMTGLRYEYQFLSDVGAAVFLQGGINFSKAASRSGMIGDVKAEHTSFEFARDFGYELGLSLNLFKKWQLGFSYLSLNTPRFEGTRTLSEKVFPQIFSRENRILGEERSVSMYLISLGYQLF
ncbi:MAG: hypothetical protein ONB16_05470 [candidate division KSB1 bacterium]|nr:hypothetical protein [candidate division KSB1 bacterium]MDZ7401099.1 hypothetical protein [candidate division KSB1 bacterium]